MMEAREKLARWTRQPPARVEGRRAAVLVPLFVREARLWTVFTRRTESLEHHRGQIGWTLKQAGRPLDAKTSFGLWEWGVR